MAALCCRQNVVRRPNDRARPPLANIAELTAGLLSHVDLDATDITTALLLASAAQNRRRRLRVAKALLPVYKALRTGGGGGGGSSGGGAASASDIDEPSASEAGEGDDASSTASRNDLPADRELDRLIAAQEAQRERAMLQVPAQVAAGKRLPAPVEEVEEEGVGNGEPPAVASPLPQPRPTRKGKTVSWAQDQAEPAAARQGAAAAPQAALPDLSGISLPPPAARQLARDSGVAAVVSTGADTAGRLPLTEENVAALDEATPPAGGPLPTTAADERAAGAAALQAEALLGEAPGDSLLDRVRGWGKRRVGGWAWGLCTYLQHADPCQASCSSCAPPAAAPQECADQLANVIEEELAQLGSGDLPEGAVLQMERVGGWREWGGR